MEKKNPTNKQILDAYGQSYKLMQEAKRHDDIKQKAKKSTTSVFKDISNQNNTQ